MLLKISKFLEKLSFKLRSTALYFELKHYIKNGKNYIKPVYIYTRGIGKTYNLLKLAHKYKCPIIVSTKGMEKYIMRLNRDHFKSPVEIIVASNNCRGKRLGLALIEEGIDNRLIREVIKPMCKQIIGYEFWQ